MTGSEPVFLTYDEAVALLPGSERIHTYLDGSLALIGADWDRAQILNLLREAGPQGIQVTGPAAQSAGHGLAAFRADGTPVFIETGKS
jgi:hypothetical protein